MGRETKGSRSRQRLGDEQPPDQQPIVVAAAAVSRK